MLERLKHLETTIPAFVIVLVLIILLIADIIEAGDFVSILGAIGAFVLLFMKSSKSKAEE
jgi:amino acid permease